MNGAENSTNRRQPFQSATNRDSLSYVPVNKRAAMEDGVHDIGVACVQYLLVIDSDPSAPAAPLASPIRLAICDVYKARRMPFSPPDTDMWFRDGTEVRRNVPCDIESQVLEKLVIFNFKAGLSQSVYEKQCLEPGTMMWSTYIKMSMK